MRIPTSYLFKGGALCFASVVIFLAGRSSVNHSQSNPPQTTETRVSDSALSMLNPLLDCDVEKADAPFQEVGDFSEALNAYIAKAQADGLITDVGFYFRDLNNGPWRAVNADMDFAPASLLKLPIMMAYLKAAEVDPTILAQKLSYTGEAAASSELQPDTPPELELHVGGIYKVGDLIERMIVYSDNNAKDLLRLNLPNDAIANEFEAIGLSKSLAQNADTSMSVQDYATFFRVLYNASYLSRTYSNMALEYLARTTFSEGIVAGLPEDMKVAHKYGIRNISTDGSLHQLHDCGIVYYPTRPYLICVMTRGGDVSKLASVIRVISSIVYGAVSKGR